ncbi:hypothetical protein EDC56_1210 [Sinobacterium caligoides]|uniref:Uncharacterized protein n=1 Tax=Sinobacterium caligoides TaxID=933926 RepID=A0A3N2E0N8_9GAMM|nr:hypothetical protein [Sinobacterium caligoides]ROS05664.1 hypothetical protein EDC56_1210 [Sinobacterium caligoides]
MSKAIAVKVVAEAADGWTAMPVMNTYHNKITTSNMQAITRSEVVFNYTKGDKSLPPVTLSLKATATQLTQGRVGVLVEGDIKSHATGNLLKVDEVSNNLFTK